MFKCVRIAVTAFSLTACVLLVALWVRSFWWIDCLEGPILWPHGWSLTSTQGRFMLAGWSEEDPITAWAIGSIEVSSPYALPMKSLGPVFAFNLSQSDGAYVHFPHWCPALLATTVGFFAIKPRRFSLRTLLIATTLVAVGLGIIAISS